MSQEYFFDNENWCNYILNMFFPSDIYCLPTRKCRNIIMLSTFAEDKTIFNYTGMDKTSLDTSSGNLFVRDSLTHSVRISTSRRT